MITQKPPTTTSALDDTSKAIAMLDIKEFTIKPSIWDRLRLLFIREQSRTTSDGTLRYKMLSDRIIVTGWTPLLFYNIGGLTVGIQTPEEIEKIRHFMSFDPLS